jgi:hypothetical protein
MYSDTKKLHVMRIQDGIPVIHNKLSSSSLLQFLHGRAVAVGIASTPATHGPLLITRRYVLSYLRYGRRPNLPHQTARLPHAQIPLLSSSLCTSNSQMYANDAPDIAPKPYVRLF